MSASTHRLVVLSGPSCVGKSPLKKALARCYPEVAGSLRHLVLYNSRPPRPGERDGIDYHFRDRETVAALRADPDFVVLEVRGDLQALDRRTLLADLGTADLFFEGNPFVGRQLLEHPDLAGVPKTSVFLSPLAREEIEFLKTRMAAADLRALVAAVMRRKLLRRTRRQQGELSSPDLEDIERRAGSAWRELGDAHRFGLVIPNHDGEDSEHWDAFYYPLGDARKALLAFVELLAGRTPGAAERWPPDLIP